jgi:UMF1 family MFS transporter
MDAPARLDRGKQQRAWYWYDWANSAYVTTTATVLFGPYLTTVAKRAACPGQDTELACTTDLTVLGVPVSPGSVALYTVTVATLLSAVLLPMVGAVVDRTGRKRAIMAGFAWVGAAAAASMVAVSGTNWQLGSVLQLIASICLGSSLVAYDAILIDIAEPDERDRVSSRGWALGYLGGGVLLVINLALISGLFGLSTETAVRVSLFSAGLWWAGFTLVPYLGLRDLPDRGSADRGSADRGSAAEGQGDGHGVGPDPGAPDGVRRGLVTESFGQLRHTLTHLRGYPQTLLFLVAYLFYNDGIQTVIYASSIFGQEQLGLSSDQLVITILVVQFIGILGALAFGWLAARIGAQRSILGALVLWCGVVSMGYLLPVGAFGLFLALAVLIGIVLGGSQALSRSLFSQLIPRGREAEYFSLYQAAERGTSWFGTLLFGLVFQLTDSYRNAIIALVVFFVLGGSLLVRVDIRRGISEAGNAVPQVV